MGVTSLVGATKSVIECAAKFLDTSEPPAIAWVRHVPAAELRQLARRQTSHELASLAVSM
jgi:hypothetical protein